MNVDPNALTQTGFAIAVAGFLLNYVVNTHSKKTDKIINTLETINHVLEKLVKAQKGKK